MGSRRLGPPATRTCCRRGVRSAVGRRWSSALLRGPRALAGSVVLGVCVVGGFVEAGVVGVVWRKAGFVVVGRVFVPVTTAPPVGYGVGAGDFRSAGSTWSRTGSRAAESGAPAHPRAPATCGRRPTGRARKGNPGRTRTRKCRTARSDGVNRKVGRGFFARMQRRRCGVPSSSRECPAARRKGVGRLGEHTAFLANHQLCVT